MPLFPGEYVSSVGVRRASSAAPSTSAGSGAAPNTDKGPLKRGIGFAPIRPHRRPPGAGHRPRDRLHGWRGARDKPPAGHGQRPPDGHAPDRRPDAQHGGPAGSGALGRHRQHRRGLRHPRRPGTFMIGRCVDLAARQVDQQLRELTQPRVARLRPRRATPGRQPCPGARRPLAGLCGACLRRGKSRPDDRGGRQRDRDRRRVGLRRPLRGGGGGHGYRRHRGDAPGCRFGCRPPPSTR